MNIKKILTGFLTITMAISMMSVPAMAVSENSISSISTVLDGSYFDTEYHMVIKHSMKKDSVQQFNLALKNAEFAKYTADGKRMDKANKDGTCDLTYGIIGEILKGTNKDFKPTVKADKKIGSFVVGLYDKNGKVVPVADYLDIISCDINKSSVSDCVLKVKKEVPAEYDVVLFMNLKVDSANGEDVKLDFNGESSVFSSSSDKSAKIFVDSSKKKDNSTSESKDKKDITEKGKGNDNNSTKVKSDDKDKKVSGNPDVKGEKNIISGNISSQVKKAEFVIGNTIYNVNGKKFTMDVAPYIDKNNRTMVPIRYVAYAMGINESDVIYDLSGKRAIIEAKDRNIKIAITTDLTNFIVVQNDGKSDKIEKVVTMDTKAINREGRIYVPARFISEALGAIVTWDGAARTVRISR